jgi:hypothetical protein
LLKQSLITVYLWPTKENKLPFPFAANKQKLPFSVSSVAEFQKHGDMDMET